MNTMMRQMAVLLNLGLLMSPVFAADRWHSSYRTDRPGYSQSVRVDHTHSAYYRHGSHHHAHHHWGDAFAVAALATIAYAATQPSYTVWVDRPVYSYSTGNARWVSTQSYPVTYSYPVSGATTVYSAPIESTGPVVSSSSSGRYSGPTYRYYCSDPAGYSPDVDHCRGGWSRVPVN